MRLVQAVALLCGAAWPLCAAAQTPTLTIEQLQSVNSLVGGRDAPQWTPDGSAILFQSSLDGGLWTVPAAGGFPMRFAPMGGLGGVGSLATPRPQFSPDGHWVAYVSDKGGAPELYLISTETAREQRLTNLGGRINAFSFSPDSRTIAFAEDRYGNMDIWTVSVPAGQAARLTSDARYEVYPSFTPDGKKIVYTRMNEDWVDHDVFEMDVDGGNPRLIVGDKDFFDYRAGAAFGYARVSPDGKQLLFRSQRSGWANFWVVPLAGGEPRQIAAEAADQTDGRWSPDGRRILYIAMNNGTQSLRVVSAAGGQPAVVVAPARGVISRAEWSPDGKRISYLLGTPTRPEDLFVVPADGGAPKQLTFSGQGGNIEQALVTPEKVEYPSADGYTIHAYLYKPAHLAPGQKVPVIMYVHGGPTGQFSDSYQLQPQFFAQQGYALLAPNVRGSAGYGKKFEDANNRDWGHGDLRDVLAGVEFMKKQPYANGKVGITGISYGGMMTMYAVAFAPGVFDAAISGSGYGDVTEFHTKVLELEHIKLLNYELGKWPGDEQTQEVYRRSSSILKAAQVTTPTMLIHGYGLDAAWRPSHDDYYPALEFARALDRNYKIFRYKAYPGETYYVYGRENTRQMLKDMLAFFDQFLRNGPATPPTPLTLAPTAAAQGGSGGAH